MGPASAEPRKLGIFESLAEGNAWFHWMSCCVRLMCQAKEKASSASRLGAQRSAISCACRATFTGNRPDPAFPQ